MGGKRAAVIMVVGFALGASLLPAGPSQAQDEPGDQVVLVEPSGQWHIRLPGSLDYTFHYGEPGDIPLLGDWDGDGIDTPGVYRPAMGLAYLTNQIPAYGSSDTKPDLTFFFGLPGDQAFAGDWDGDGVDTLGLSRYGQVFLANRNATTIAESVFWFGTPSDITYGGDADGNGTDGIFLHRTSSATVFYTRDTPASFLARTSGSFYFGAGDDRLVVGDWDGDGDDSPGVFRPATGSVHLRNQVSTGATDGIYPFGRHDWQPVAGNIHRHVPPTDPVAPLTGLVGGDASRRVVIAKISNSSKARPQAGINQADLVMEVIVEGGVGRWIALFQTEYPDLVGPLRSVREVDPKLIEPFDARVLHSGGQAFVRRSLAEVAVDEGNGRIAGYYREAGRRAVYDLMYNFDRLPVDDWAGTVEPVLRYDAMVPSGGEAATNIDIAMSSPNTLAWEYDGAKYVRHQSGSTSVDAAGVPITAATVVVVFVEQISTGRFDSAGSPVPDYTVTGGGEAVVFRNGKAWPGTWERNETGEFFRLLGADGRELPMDPGRTWVHTTPTTGNVDWR